MTAKSLLFMGFVCAVSFRSVNPGPVTKCDVTDPKCLKKSTQEFLPVFAVGIPEYNVETLDPLHVKSLDASSHNLKLLLKNMTLTGLKDCVAKKVIRKETSLVSKLLCDVHGEGRYEMHGRLLVLPIEGSGKAQVTLNKIQMTVQTELISKVGKDGKDHWHVTGRTYAFQLKDKAHLKFENLFNGNQLLSRAAEEVIESSSNDIIVEVGPPVVEFLVDKITENINNFLEAVPAEELSLN